MRPSDQSEAAVRPGPPNTARPAATPLLGRCAQPDRANSAMPAGPDSGSHRTCRSDRRARHPGHRQGGRPITARTVGSGSGPTPPCRTPRFHTRQAGDLPTTARTAGSDSGPTPPCRTPRFHTRQTEDQPITARTAGSDSRRSCSRGCRPDRRRSGSVLPDAGVPHATGKRPGGRPCRGRGPGWAAAHGRALSTRSNLPKTASPPGRAPALARRNTAWAVEHSPGLTRPDLRQTPEHVQACLDVGPGPGRAPSGRPSG